MLESSSDLVVQTPQLIEGQCEVVPSASKDVSPKIRLNHERLRITKRKKRNSKEYIERVAKKYGEDSNMKLTPRPEPDPYATSTQSIHCRLKQYDTPCRPSDLTCEVHLCGRSFSSIQTLAYHMSYSHQDMSSAQTSSCICYVCGMQMPTVKGKLSHLVSRHRTISQEHNAQCIEQREPVISPSAPAAARLYFLRNIQYLDYLNDPETSMVREV